MLIIYLPTCQVSTEGQLCASQWYKYVMNMRNISWNMNGWTLRCGLWILSTSFRVTSLALWYWEDCAITVEETLKYMCEYITEVPVKLLMKHNKTKYHRGCTYCKRYILHSKHGLIFTCVHKSIFHDVTDKIEFLVNLLQVMTHTNRRFIMHV